MMKGKPHQLWMTSGPRRSSKQSKLLVKLNDYVVNSSVRYGIEKFVCYYMLSESNLCFATNLNKSIEPSCYEDAMCHINWLDAMNSKIKDLNSYNTWTVYDLPASRKPIDFLTKWNVKLTTSLDEHGFKQRKFDYSLYVKQSGKIFVALLLYVDDIVIKGNNDKKIDEFKKFLSSRFLIKDLGKLKYFLEIRDLENINGLCITQ
ncbi:ribonuclease H-like domain-containing protein [Tanacetum coccineum]